MSQLRVHEIYTSIQGESTAVGLPCVFIRLAGCPLRCGYCDTPHALEFDSGNWMSIDEIIRQVRLASPQLVLVTGGEPLAQKQTTELLQALLQEKQMVQLETSGAISVKNVPDQVVKVLDIKTPGSGEAERNHWQNLEYLTERDEVKFVLLDRQDYEWARNVVRQQLQDSPAAILFSPCWGSLNARELVAWILEDALNVRMQLQLHKVIWGAEKTGV